MASSSYYYQLMKKYGNEKRALENKKEEYVAYKDKLKKLYNDVSLASEPLELSYKSFNKKAVVMNGENLYGPSLLECFNILEESNNRLNIVINKIEDDISDMISQINDLKDMYKEAEKDYKEAKRRELSMS